MTFFVLTGEIDTRFSFCAVATLALLVCTCDFSTSILLLGIYNTVWFEDDSRPLFFSKGKMDAINVDKAVEFVLSCMNFDGGFGCRPGSESHAGQVSLLTHSFNNIIHLCELKSSSNKICMPFCCLSFRFIAALASCLSPVSCTRWTLTCWAGGSARDSCRLEASMDDQRRFVLLMTNLIPARNRTTWFFM